MSRQVFHRRPPGARHVFGPTAAVVPPPPTPPPPPCPSPAFLVGHELVWRDNNANPFLAALVFAGSPNTERVRDGVAAPYAYYSGAGNAEPAADDGASFTFFATAMSAELAAADGASF